MDKMNRKDLSQKIEKAILEHENMTELERINLGTITDYCYRDGMPTIWDRKAIDLKRNLVLYQCNECESKREYKLVRKE